MQSSVVEPPRKDIKAKSLPLARRTPGEVCKSLGNQKEPSRARSEKRSRVFGTYWTLVAAQGSISVQSPEEEENERQMQELDRDLSRRVECPLLNCPGEGSPYPLPLPNSARNRDRNHLNLARPIRSRPSHGGNSAIP